MSGGVFGCKAVNNAQVNRPAFFVRISAWGKRVSEGEGLGAHFSQNLLLNTSHPNGPEIAL